MQTTNTITLTEAAIAHIKQWVPAQAGQSHTIRLTLKKSGCSGFSYQIEPGSPTAADQTITVNNEIALVVSSELLPKLAGMVIDYARSGLNSGFRYFNLNEKGSCGCGESVSL
jgi:iron-sulfur cluster assembly protein